MDERIRAAVDVAARYGVSATGPRVLRDRSNLLVHLQPAPVVARIAAQTATVRPGTAWLGREVAVASFLAERGAPVVPPSPLLPAGPFEQDGVALSFWTFVAEHRGPVDPLEAGRALRRCHDLLVAFPGALPRWGALHEVDRLLVRIARTERIDVERARERLRILLQRLEPLPVQPVHGDAHLGNVLRTADGPRWTDWEDAFLAPVGWDLACLVASDRPGSAVAVAATGHDLPQGFDRLVEARRLQGAAWTVVLGRARDDEAMAERGIAALRD